jgi:ornithine decarboxylase
MRTFSGVNDIVEEYHPDEPIHIFRPHTLEKAAKYFNANFNGRVVYAVKTNPSPNILKNIYSSGINSFDVASLSEVELVKNLLPETELFFMHTVKSRKAIRLAYFEYGVRNFSLDSLDELEKILAETNYAKDLNLFVRLAIPNTYAELTLSDKFGINSKDAPALLKKTRQYANKLGICFHVGSQCMHQDAYRIAIRMAKSVVTKANVTIDCLDVGGGFPSIYPGMHPPAIGDFFHAIDDEFRKLKDFRKIELICEPGRAIVAESGSLLAKVELRKDSFLYINDGTYGSLFDAGTPHFIFPVKAIGKNGRNLAENSIPFSFFGPTCDTLDFMKGPFYLPEDIEEGDYIEIGQLGAYGKTLATEFNGFKALDEVLVCTDEPLMTMYDDVSIGINGQYPHQVIAA